MKKLLPSLVLLGFIVGAHAAILIDGSFDSALTASLDSNSISHNGPYDQTDIGWVRSSIDPGNNYTYDTVTGTLRWGPSGSVYGTSTTDFGQALAQINTDNKATTGEICFDFVVDALDLNGGTSETLSMTIEVLYWNGADQTANNKIDLANGNPADSYWTSLGFVQTETITGAGTYTTDTVDLGNGYDVVAIRYVPLDNGTAAWMDYVTISSITVTNAAAAPTNAPAAPSNLTASTVSSTRISLSWTDNSDIEDGFVIERGADTNSFAEIAVNDADDVTFTDTGLSPTNEYFYRVSAFNSVGSSSNNPVASAVTTDTPPPVGETSGLPYAACHPPGLTYYEIGGFANLLWSCGSLWNPVGNWKDKDTDAEIRRTLDTNGYVTAGSQIDKFGNPQYLDAGQVLDTTFKVIPEAMLNGHHVYDGRMALTWEGTADIRLRFTGTQVVGSTSGMETDGRREYNSTQTEGYMYVEIYAIDTNDPPHNIALWAPDPADWDNSTLEGQLLHPAMTARLQDADWGFVRYMDIQSTIMTREAEWHDRRLPEDCFQIGPINTIVPATQWTDEELSCVGMAYEHIIEMINQSGLDAWICVPWDATPDYMEKMANLFMYGSDGETPYTSAVTNPVYPPLDSNLKIYLEKGNEAWNYRKNDLEANRGSLTKGQYAAHRFSECWDIFESVMGTGRIVRAAAIFTAVSSYTEEMLDELYDDPTLLDPEVVAVTTYFGNGIQNYVWDEILGQTAPASSYWTSQQFADDMDQAFDQWLRLAMTGILYGGSTGPDKLDAQGIPDYLRDYCAAKGVPVVAYEGGPSIYTDQIDTPSNPDGAALTEFMVAMNGDPRITEVYDLQTQLSKEDGLNTHMPFLLYGPWGKYGQWGHLETLFQDPADAVKYRYILDFMEDCTRVRHVYDPSNNVPAFTTEETLPYVLQSYPCDIQINTAGGDGARSNKVVAALLPDGLSIDSDFHITGTPTEAGDFHLYLRVVDADGDPAWSFFRLTSLGSTVGLPLVEWEFLNDTELDALPTAYQDPDSTYNAAGMMSSTLGMGPGLENRDNSGYNDDAYVVLFADSPSLDLDDYINWTVQSQAGKAMNLYSMQFGITGTHTDYPVYFDLQYSLDGFATAGTVITLPTNMVLGVGNTGDGTTIFADLSGYPDLQNCDQPVEFRLYVWGTDSAYTRVNFGKQSTLEGDAVDVRISGILTDAGDDSDADLLPDDWETLYFGGPTNANPTAMASNGINTVLEAYIAGLDPTDPAARFEVSNVWNLVTPPALTLQWNAASGRVYTIYWTSNLLSSFQPLDTNTSGIFTDTLHGAEDEGFYKIDVQVAP